MRELRYAYESGVIAGALLTLDVTDTPSNVDILYWGSGAGCDTTGGANTGVTDMLTDHRLSDDDVIGKLAGSCGGN